MNILNTYKSLTDQNRWKEALPIIQEIVERAPHISTSWFNWGVCLSELGLESEAAEKYIKAYELDPGDYGAQYRVFRSLYLAKDFRGFLDFAESECEKNPEMIEVLVEDEDFSSLFQRPEFIKLRQKYE